MSIRIIISDNELTGHPETVREGILCGYGTGLTEAEIPIKNGGFASDIAYAHSEGAIGIVRSIDDLNSCITIAESYFPTILTSFAFLSNSHIPEATPATLPRVVTFGAGIYGNETAYGPGLWFWDYDIDMVDPDLSSFSNGRGFGKLLYIKDVLSCTWQEALYRAAITGTEGGVWNSVNGYGRIQTAAAIALVLPKRIEKTILLAA
jgi:hypothetical protein